MFFIDEDAPPAEDEPEDQEMKPEVPSEKSKTSV